MKKPKPVILPAAFEIQRDAFLEAMKVRGYSPCSLKTYENSLGVLFNFLSNRGVVDLRQVQEENVKDFCLWLRSQDYSNWTVLTRIQALRCFFKYLESVDAILINPCADLAFPKMACRLPKAVLTVTEAKAVLNAPDTQTDKGLRDKAILEMFYSTGLRLEEMTQLSIHDVDGAEGFVRVRQGKCAKDRVVPLGRTACDWVAKYVRQVREKWSPACGNERALWLSSREPHIALKSQIIEVLVKNYGRQASLSKTLTPHVWRHTCASHLVADGANIVYVQQLLGHRSLRTTQVYVRSTLSEIKAAHARAHPRNQNSVT